MASLVWGEGEDWASDPTAHWETRQTLPAILLRLFLTFPVAPDTFHKNKNVRNVFPNVRITVNLDIKTQNLR